MLSIRISKKKLIKILHQMPEKVWFDIDQNRGTMDVSDDDRQIFGSLSFSCIEYFNKLGINHGNESDS